MAVFANDPKSFRRLLYEAVNHLIARRSDFSIDDVWAYLTLRGVEPRAPDSAIVGATMNSFRRRGLIAHTERFIISARGPAKGRRVSVWQVKGGAL